MTTPVGRWSFEAADGSLYVFPINPNAEGSRVPVRNITWDRGRDGFSGIREGRQPFPWEFSGVVRSQEQFEAFVAWANRREWITVTDDFGRQLIVRLLAFEPKQEAGTRNVHAPWRHTYTMKGLIKP